VPGLLHRLRAWWRKDDLEEAKEETRMTEDERDVAEEDYEGRKDDVMARHGFPEERLDFDSDEEPPRDPAP
jgi:hypothetical protein